MKKIISLLALYFVVFQALVSCGIYRPVDAKKYPPQPELRVKNNIEVGRGFKLTRGFGNNGKNGKFEFANANPLWRASLDILDFIPMATVDYSGGTIVSDWYNDGSKGDESIKITLRFLSNEIRSESLKVVVHKKNCSVNQTCKINLIKNSILINELQSSILRKAARLQIEQRKKK